MSAPEHLHLRPAAGPCEVHDWPTDGMGRRLVKAMRENHPRGVNVCRECIDRAHGDAARGRAR